jgi:hypothetical protein
MKTVITIFTIPQEIDDFQRCMIQLKNASKYLNDNHNVVLDVVISLSSYLTDWVSSYIPKSYFEDKFKQICKYADWCDETSTFKILHDNEILGCTSYRRKSWLKHKDADNFIWLDMDVVFDERTLVYLLSAASQIETPYYVISPQTVKLWDSTWDCLVNDGFKDKDYGYERKECDPFIDSGVKGDISVERIYANINGQPKMKFGGGWFNLISKPLLDVITVPEELGHYGLDDTFLMWGCEIFPKGEQYMVKNLVVCEDYKYRNRIHYTNLITIVNRIPEFLEIAHSNVNKCLTNLKNRLS